MQHNNNIFKIIILLSPQLSAITKHKVRNVVKIEHFEAAAANRNHIKLFPVVSEKKIKNIKEIKAYPGNHRT